ncbi:glycerophosphodiester phosphodiesterase [Parachitinimonas caeni]|uniref:glycerophosphodiester phosphodiesterase n=1 Tax=Parachitinimonas caeni TaxID=3031301 RepID=A0ABT7E2C8_9NEIS|nr:glycerophosphodiester phosphodiesterase [Parachitinimonas caeni]MDK2126463.1 glycerophosphodiester phosphodiesterase [Parachitinimonas caeni]
MKKCLSARRLGQLSVLALAVAATPAVYGLSKQASKAGASKPARPLIIGHRGAPGYLPEHTIEGYTLAIEMGVDYIEPDLVSTKDGVLIARHEPNMIATTDVAEHPEFADRKKTIKVDGVEETGFFASDFTLAEIKTLRAKQAFAERDQSHNGKYLIPTFDEVIALAQAKSKALKRTIGVYPETKHPTWHRDLNLPLEDKLLASLDKAGWNRADAPVFIQSFEQSNLKALRSKTKVKLVQLIDGGDIDLKTGAITYAAPSDRPYDWTRAGRAGTYADLLTPAGLDDVKTYADAIGPWKRYIVSVKATYGTDGKAVDVNGDGKVNDADYTTLINEKLVKDIKQRGLQIHTWTFRNEPRRLASNYAGDPGKEYLQFFQLGVDGEFSDFPDSAVFARKAFMAGS